MLIAALGEDSYPVGRSCCYPDGFPPAINKADCFRLRCNSNIALNGYVMNFLNMPAARNQMRRFEQGVTRQRVNLGNMRRIVVALPDINEQQRIVRLIFAASGKVEISEILGEKLKLKKHGLMYDLLTGRVRVPVPETSEA